jgi:tetratricopeptide (TPR) repeat protein
MKRLLILAVAAFTAAGCTAIRDFGHDENPYENPFYAKYLNTGSTLDTQINRTLEGVRQNPDSAELHNNLGMLLVEKGFPKDAEREFERSINTDRKYFAAWYNLGLVRASRGDKIGAHRAFARTVDLKPGHAPALFQLGLVEEGRHHTDRAVRYYAKAFSINPALLRVEVNPRIVDTKLGHLALLEMYPREHARRSTQYQGTVVIQSGAPAPTGPVTPPPAPSVQPQPRNIVTPAPPATEIIEPTPVHAPGQPAPGRRSGRGRQPRPATTTTPAPDANGQPTTPPANPPNN